MTNEVALDVAYHLEFEKSFLSIGIKVGVVNYDFDQAIIRTTTIGDNSFVFDGEGGLNLILVLEFITIGLDGMQDSPSHGLLKMKALTYKDIIMVLWEE